MANKPLGEMIGWLQEMDQSRTVRNGFGAPHSDRGHYSDLAFDPVDETTFGKMLSYARSAVGETFHGYKGGEYVMHHHTDVLIGEWGCCGENITDTHLRYWFEQENDNG